MLLAFRLKGEKTRERIVAAIHARPGITMNEVSARLGIYWNAVRHHVKILERRGRIEVEDRSWSHELYVVGIPPKYRPWLRALHHEDSSKVLGALLERRELGVYALSDELGFSRKVVRNHLARLIDDGIVEKVGQNRPRYRPREVPPEVHDLLPDMRWPAGDGPATASDARFPPAG